MRSIASLVLVLSLAAAVVVVGVLALVQDPRNDSAIEALTAGRLERVFTPPAVWEGLLGLHQARWRWFVHSPAAAIAAAFCLAALWWLKLKHRRSWLLVGLACLLLAPGFYVGARVALAASIDPEAATRWSSLTLLGTLYGLAACAFFAGIQTLSHSRGKHATAR